VRNKDKGSIQESALSWPKRGNFRSRRQMALVFHARSDNAVVPTKGATVTIHYAFFANGKKFESTRDGNPLNLTVGSGMLSCTQ